MTEKSVWIDGRRHTMKSRNHSFFMTYEAAKANLLKRIDGEMRAAKAKILRCEEALNQLNANTTND